MYTVSGKTAPSAGVSYRNYLTGSHITWGLKSKLSTRMIKALEIGLFYEKKGLKQQTLGKIKSVCFHLNFFFYKTSYSNRFTQNVKCKTCLAPNFKTSFVSQSLFQ